LAVGHLKRKLKAGRILTDLNLVVDPDPKFEGKQHLIKFTISQQNAQLRKNLFFSTKNP